MHLHRTLVFLSLLLAISFSPAFARGVLLPSDDNADTATLPNLGLVPRKEKSSVPQNTAPIINKSSAYGNESSEPNPFAPSQKELEGMISNNSSQKKTLHLNPGGSLAPSKKKLKQEANMAKLIASGKYPKESMVQTSIKKMMAQKEEYMKKYARDPLIFEEHEIRPLPPEYTKYAIDVGISPSYMWGEHDIENIEKMLGYDAEDIPKNCQLRIDFTARTEAEAASFKEKVLAGTKSNLRYSEKLVSIDLQPRALCRQPSTPLPRKGGLIMRTGNLYGVLLRGNTSCIIDHKLSAPRSLFVQYNGDGKVTCKFN